jgi:hypothetical protein
MSWPQHWLLVFGGKLNASGAGGEIWQCGIRGVPGVAAAYGQEDATLANIQPAMAAWFSSSANLMRSDADLRFLKLNQIGPDGKYTDSVTHQVDFGPVNGGAASDVPFILTAAISWVTDAARGLAHTGRIYPPVALPSGASMQIAGSVLDQLVTSGKNLLAAAAAASSTSPATSFQGIAGRVVSSQGAIRAITGVRVGSVIDVQRRRKDALVESYHQAAYP